MQAATPPKRVTNSMASLLAGSSHRRLVILLDRAELMGLAEVADLMVAIPGVIRRVVLGVVEIKREGDSGHTMRVVVQDEEYLPMLRDIGSALAHRDGVTALRWRGRTLSPRAWGPFVGVQRRGLAARRRFQNARNLSGERMNRVVELLWRVYTFGELPQ